MKTYSKSDFPNFSFHNNINYDPIHQREEVSFSTLDLEIVSEKRTDGWIFKETNDGFILRAPEEWLVDLSDPYKISYYSSPEINLSYFIFLKNLVNQSQLNDFIATTLEKEKYQGFQFQILKGPALETEIRIAGSDKRLNIIKKKLFTAAQAHTAWNEALQEAKALLQNTRDFDLHYLTLEETESHILSFFKKVQQLYEPFNTFKRDSFNQNFITNLFDDLPDADIYVFVPWSCFRYILSYAVKNDLNKVMFWEIHADSKAGRMNRFMGQDLAGKRVLIIDNSYTGSTLNLLAKKIKDAGGIPERLALFPKSKVALENCEYYLFINKIFKADNDCIWPQDWYLSIYQKVLSKC